MRFSLKWVLVGMAYVAVAATAFGQPSWVYADILWMLSLLAMVFAALLMIFARGQRQVAAAGFIVASLSFVACVVWSSLSGQSVPSTRLLIAAGVGQREATPIPIITYPATPPVAGTPVAVGEATVDTYVDPADPAVAASPTPVPATAPQVWYAPTPYYPQAATDPMAIRAGNAVGVMLFGGVGCLLGLMAYKVARHETVESLKK